MPKWLRMPVVGGDTPRGVGGSRLPWLAVGARPHVWHSGYRSGASIRAAARRDSLGDVSDEND